MQFKLGKAQWGVLPLTPLPSHPAHWDAVASYSLVPFQGYPLCTEANVRPPPPHPPVSTNGGTHRPSVLHRVSSLSRCISKIIPSWRAAPLRVGISLPLFRHFSVEYWRPLRISFPSYLSIWGCTIPLGPGHLNSLDFLRLPFPRT